MEMQYELRSDGIPTKSCPVDVDGNIRQDILNGWFDKHQSELEEAKKPF